MSAPATARPLAEQHALNRQVWDRIVDDPRFEDVLERVETDRDGRLIMSPPPLTPHRVRQQRISELLNRLLPEGGHLRRRGRFDRSRRQDCRRGLVPGPLGPAHRR